MLVVIDIGNSRIKAAVAVDGKLSQQCAVDKPKVGVLQKVLTDLMVAFPEPDRILATNVAGVSFEKAVMRWVKKTWKIKAEFTTTSFSVCGVTNGYSDPLQLGVDRWFGMIGARAVCQSAVCVIDCGTALTVDVLDSQGKHLGGLIIPGVSMMMSSLVKEASGLSLDEINSEKEVSLLARDTYGGMYGGVFYTLVAMIDHLVKDISNELEGEVNLLLTGGDAEKLFPLVSYMHCRYEPDLVLKGLAVFAGRPE